MALTSNLDFALSAEEEKQDKNLKFYCKFLTEFTYLNKEGKKVQKQLETIVYFKDYQPETSMQSTLKDVKSLNLKALISQNGVTAIFLLLMVFCIFYYDRLCKGYQEAEVYEGRIDQVLQGLCNHKQGFVLNISVAFLALTVLRRITKPRQGLT